ncbi:MAG: cell division protein FtsH [Candidatus Omnitrophica bacterium CG22_combo_CG10-13_8_21_14_all_43_16]|nr:MAG: cell division protein FtsH [Candidatus Omnitrophica bacterium CG22_combo_CG10-13_8_21_14_all_43_16]
MALMNYRKLRMHFTEHWVKIVVGLTIIILLILAIWGMMSLESFYRHLTIAQMPISILLAGLNAGIFVFMYMIFLHGGFSKIKQATVKGQNVNIHWEDVIGMEEAKQEAMEVVGLIKDRTKLLKIGGKILKGLLMVGPPGCGKTYLAKAIATEAGIPFISMSGSEFTEIFVGVGASRVRKLFKKARNLAYGHGACIIFIDELDAIGRQRSFSFMGGGQETNSTQNQLLVEMDGLQEKDYNVIIIGATNAAEGVLDEALLRPGRFDRKIYIDRPNLQEREKVFEYYLNKVKHDQDVDIGRLARQAVHKSPAEIENMIKEAALIATRNKKETVGHKELSEAMERIDMGLKHRKHMTKEEKEMVAFHETGHLVVMYMLHPTDDVFKASIISRKESLGAVHHQPREELYTNSKEKILADIKVSIGGYVAEKTRFGTTSDGVAMDFRNAMWKAHNMVWMVGMSDAGYIGDYTIIPKSQLSESLKEKLNAETDKIIKSCLKDVEDLLKKEWPIVERFAKELLEKEELEYDEIEAIFKECGKSHNCKKPA